MQRGKDHIDWELLARYVAGESSREEVAGLEARMAIDPHYARGVDEARQVWNALADEREIDFDERAAWHHIQATLREREADRARAAEEASITSRRAANASADRKRAARRASASRRRRRSRRSMRTGMGLLAAVAATVLMIVWMMEPFPSPTPEEPAKVFTTERGQRAIVELTDGTRVHLNVDSKLVLMPGFPEGERREVRLVGEGYFDVAGDTTQPFFIHTGNASVRVLGTAFGVRAYDDEETQVVVEEGHVQLRPENDRVPDARAVLAARQIGRVAEGRLHPVERDVVTTRHLAWIQGRLVFINAPFHVVVRRLERWYDIEIDARLPTDAVDRLTARFADKSIDEVLSDIAVALNLQYEKDGRSVTFYRKTVDRATSSERPSVLTAR